MLSKAKTASSLSPKKDFGGQPERLVCTRSKHSAVQKQGRFFIHTFIREQEYPGANPSIVCFFSACAFSFAAFVLSLPRNSTWRSGRTANTAYSTWLDKLRLTVW
jgi:hypothetical protein